MVGIRSRRRLSIAHDSAEPAYRSVVGEREGKGNTVALEKGLVRADEHSPGADIFCAKRQLTVPVHTLDVERQCGATAGSRCDIEKVLHVRVKTLRFVREGKNRVYAALLAAIAVVRCIPADDEGADGIELPTLFDERKKLFHAHAGQIKAGDDQIDCFPPVDLKYIVVRCSGKNDNIFSFDETIALLKIFLKILSQ